MPPRASGRRRLLPLALVAAGLIAVVLVVGLTGADGGWISSWWRGSGDEATSEDLLAPAAAVPGAAGGPTLRAAPSAKPRETHGPVTVTVTDLQGVAVEGLRVLAVVTEPPKEDGTVTTSETAGLTDASGRARFADLPYDGRARVFASALRPGDDTTSSATNLLSGLPWVISRTATSFTLFRRAAEPAGGAEAPPEVTDEAAEAELTEEVVEEEEVVQPHVVSMASVEPGIFTFMPSASAPGAVLAEAVVLGPELTLAIDRGLPLRLDVREGGEGRLRPDARWQVRPRLVWADDAYGATTLPLQRGRPATVTCRVEAPRGFVARKEASWSTTIHPLAQRLVATYPLRPAVEVILLVPPEGMPYRAEDWEGTVTVAGVTLENPELHVDAQGRLHVQGGAHIVGDRVEVSGTLAKRFHASGEGFIGGDSRDPVLVRLALASPEVPAATFNQEVPAATFYNELVFDLGSGHLSELRLSAGAGIRVRVSENLLVTTGEQDGVAPGYTGRLVERPLPEVPRRAPLPVRSVAWHGGPAAGALLRLGDQELAADAQGRATFHDVPDGQASIQVLGAGATTTIALEVGPGARPEAVLVAPVGGTLEIEVVDSEGRPLPYAHVELTQSGELPHMDCVDGVQRLDPYTDAAGRRTLRFVTPGPVKVRAYYGTRNAECELLLVDGATETARLVLPVLKPPPPPEPPASDAPPEK